VLDYDALWLDAAIVAGLGRDDRSALVARFIATLGRDAGVAIGAKGVTTADQAAILRQVGVERAQGDAFSPRICANTVARLLANGEPLAPTGPAAAPEPVR
jgi:EAL domain-containing protein (putative c-di-GMP-specific phosphodiesterase class I)